MSNPESRVAVGYVHGNLVHGSWHDALMTLCLTQGIGARISIEGTSRIATARNQVVQTFLEKTECEYLWMLDTDMTFEPDIVSRMVTFAEEADIPILGALTFLQQRDGVVHPVMFRLTDSGELFSVTNYPRGDVIEVAATGAACTLIRRDVLEKMAVECDGPHHWYEEQTRDGVEIGEDVAFCLKARDLGFRIFVDTRIKTGHLKMTPVTEEVWLQHKVEAKRKRRKANRR